jgi:hypothetical protein
LRFVYLSWVILRSAISTKQAWRDVRLEGDKSCHVELLSRLLHPLSSASRVLRPFQLTPSHIALAWVVLALVALAFITVAFTMVRPYAAEWR